MTSTKVKGRLRQLALEHGWSALMMLLLVVSVGLNVVQSARIGGLREVIQRLKGEAQLAVGTQVPAMQVTALDGKPAELRFDKSSSATVIYVFSPACGWCKKNLANIKMLSSQAGSKYRFVGVSLTDKDLVSHVRENELQFPIYMNPDASSLKAYKLGGTPETVVVGPDGRVLKVWPGAFTDSSQREVEDYFGVKLPGLTES